MTDYPAIFSGPMVRAFLEGRKTMSENDTQPTCETCRFSASSGLYPQCECRRNAPISMRERGVPSPIWPLPSIHDWCGEHQPREAAQ